MKTKRLNFRKFTKTDFDLYFQLVNNHEVMKMVSGESVPLNKAKIKFEKILEISSSNPQLGYYLISGQLKNEFIGLGKIVMNDDVEAEIGYLVEPNFWNMGYGGEVSAELVRFARRLNLIKTIKAIIDPENIGSKKILLRSNFYLDEICNLDGLPAEI